MSGWQGYIDQMMGTKTLTDVGIFGFDGTPWAVSAGMQVN